MSTRLIWLHGFASGPQSSKGRYLRERLLERGAALEIPDLNLPSFHDLTVSRMLGQVDALAGSRAALCGSSLGGYTAALWAVKNPGRCAALVLLAPAFALARRWAAEMGESDLLRWSTAGEFPFDHYALGRKEQLGWRFLEDARSHEEFPEPACPTLVIQGTRDEVVDPRLAREFTRRLQARGTPVRLVELDQGHELNADLPGLWRELEAHLAPLLPG